MIGDRFAEEQAAAAPLPKHRFDPCVIRPAAPVDKYQTVAFDRNRYSVPRPFAFQMVTVKGYVDRVVIVARGQVVATHARSRTADTLILDPLHYLATLDRKPGALDHAPVYRDWKLPACFAEFRAELEEASRRRGRRTAVRAGLATPGRSSAGPRASGDRSLPSRAAAQCRSRDPADAHAGRLRGAAACFAPRWTTELTTVPQVHVPLPDLSRFNQLLDSSASRRRPRRSEELAVAAAEARWRETGHHVLHLMECDRACAGSIGELGPSSDVSFGKDHADGCDAVIDLLKTHFRQLRLPTMGREFEKLARDAAATNQNFFQFLLRLTETELATRAANAVATRIKNAEFPVLKDFDTYDFSVMPQLSKPKILELARCEWIEQKSNCCLVGSHGTGKTHIAVALGLAACRAGLRVRFFTAAELVSRAGKGPEAVHARPLPGPAGAGPPADLRRAGLRHVEPRRRRASVSGLRRPVRARQRAGHEQPCRSANGTRSSRVSG